jgi:hypothetical protein
MGLVPWRTGGSGETGGWTVGAAGGTFACRTLEPQAPQKADVSFNGLPQLPQNLAMVLLYPVLGFGASLDLVCQREYANRAVSQSKVAPNLAGVTDLGKLSLKW